MEDACQYWNVQAHVNIGAKLYNFCLEAAMWETKSMLDEFYRYGTYPNNVCSQYLWL